MCFLSAGKRVLNLHTHLDELLTQIGSFNQFGYAPKAIRFMLQIVEILWKGIKPAA